MKRGVLSHQLCCGDSRFNKHILYLTIDNRLDSIVPFRQEVSMTVFCEGVLLAVAPDFVAHEADFCQTLHHQLFESEMLTIGEAVLQNNLYRQYAVVEGDPCLLYTITSVDWSTGRLNSDEVKLVKIV